MKKLLRDEHVVQELQGQFVVVHRTMWKQKHPTALLSLVGSLMLAAGPFGSKEEAESALEALAPSA